MTVGIFAGIPVRDYAIATVVRAPLWHHAQLLPQRRRGCLAAFRKLQCVHIEDAQRAGGAVNMLWVEDPEAEVARTAATGMEPDDIEKHDSVWKYVFHDADGNETGIGGEVRYSPESWSRARTHRSSRPRCRMSSPKVEAPGYWPGADRPCGCGPRPGRGAGRPGSATWCADRR